MKIPSTTIQFDENNSLLYIGSLFFREEGKEYQRQKKYMKELIKQLWNQKRVTSSTLKDPEKIEIIKEVFEIQNLQIF